MTFEGVRPVRHSLFEDRVRTGVTGVAPVAAGAAR